MTSLPSYIDMPNQSNVQNESNSSYINPPDYNSTHTYYPHSFYPHYPQLGKSEQITPLPTSPALPPSTKDSTCDKTSSNVHLSHSLHPSQLKYINSSKNYKHNNEKIKEYYLKLDDRINNIEGDLDNMKTCAIGTCTCCVSGIISTLFCGM